jgi:hypothetical protein
MEPVPALTMRGDMAKCTVELLGDGETLASVLEMEPFRYRD